jgi:hypothetical protein
MGFLPSWRVGERNRGMTKQVSRNRSFDLKWSFNETDLYLRKVSLIQELAPLPG